LDNGEPSFAAGVAPEYRGFIRQGADEGVGRASGTRPTKGFESVQLFRGQYTTCVAEPPLLQGWHA